MKQPISDRLLYAEADAVLAGGGEMGSLMRTIDWATTPLGTVDSWPQSLRTALSVLLTSRAPIFLWWGPQLVQFYNDAYRPILGSEKHPRAMGQGGRECWSEIWHIIGPMIEHVFEGGSTAVEDGLLLLNRNGYIEEGYFNYAYSPIRGESGSVEGVFCVCGETTAKILSERRLLTLQSLASRARRADTIAEACHVAAETLGANPQDIPFAALYLYSADRSQALQAGSYGLGSQNSLCPRELDLSADTPPTLLHSLARSPRAHTLDLKDYASDLPKALWGRPPVEAMFIPINLTGEGQPVGFAILGASTCKRLDADYRGFMSLIVSHVASAIAEARAFEQERQRAEALSELDRAKTRFFSNVSHEFRTPLTLLLGPLEDTLASATQLPAGARGNIQTAHRNALRLLKLVNSLLDFSRLEEGRAQGHYESTDLAALTEDLVSTFRSATERAGLTLHVECPALAQPVWVDREMWEKIVLNLLSNAFKFTQRGGITVKLESGSNEVCLNVSDTGSGIPKEELPHLFQRFHRVEGAQGRSHEGTGIGLALVRELAQLHGGSVSVESELERGSTFTVRLPFGNTHLPSKQLFLERGTVATRNLDYYIDEAAGWLPSAAEHDPKSMPETRPAVLVVDDNRDMREYLKHLLSHDYSVVTASDGHSALKIIAQERPNLVLSDIMMPTLDGLGLLEILRSQPETRSLPVILLSARAGEAETSEGMAAGADDYIVKPFSARELLARVKAHIKLADSRRNAEQQASSILESITDAFFACDANWRYRYANSEAERLTGMTRAQMEGKVVWQVFGENSDTVFHGELSRAAAKRIPVEFDLSSAHSSRRYRVRAYPSSEGGISLFFRDVTAERQMEEALKRSNEDLEHFAYIASHDLQEPLRTLKIYSQLLQRRYRGQFNADADKFLNRLVEGSEQMERMIDGVLRFARLSTEHPPLETVSADAALQRAQANLGNLIEEQQATIEASPLPDVMAEGTQLVQVFQNFLSNALKYRRPDTPLLVKITAQPHAGECVFSISDNGRGIPTIYQDKVFHLFSRFHDGAMSGTGIGLASVRRIVARHGGRVWLESIPDVGSTFYFSLPLSHRAQKQ